MLKNRISDAYVNRVQNHIVSPLESIIENSGYISVKFVDETERFYEYYPTNNLIELLTESRWEPMKDTAISRPYVVLRIGEGYEVAIDGTGLIGIYNRYTTDNEELHCFRTENTEQITELIQSSGTECQYHDILGEFLYY